MSNQQILIENTKVLLSYPKMSRFKFELLHGYGGGSYILVEIVVLRHFQIRYWLRYFNNGLVIRLLEHIKSIIRHVIMYVPITMLHNDTS